MTLLSFSARLILGGIMGRKSKFRFFPVIIICLGFTLLAAALIGQQFYGTYTQDEQLVSLLPDDTFLIKRQEIKKEAECLVLYNSTEANSVLAEEDIRSLFEQLHVEADFADLSVEAAPSFEAYEKVVTALVEYDILGERAYELLDWVENGGGLFVYFPPQGDTFFRALSAQMGIQESGWQMYELPGFSCTSDLLLG